MQTRFPCTHPNLPCLAPKQRVLGPAAAPAWSAAHALTARTANVTRRTSCSTASASPRSPPSADASTTSAQPSASALAAWTASCPPQRPQRSRISLHFLDKTLRASHDTRPTTPQISSPAGAQGAKSGAKDRSAGKTFAPKSTACGGGGHPGATRRRGLGLAGVWGVGCAQPRPHRDVGEAGHGPGGGGGEVENRLPRSRARALRQADATESA